AVSSSLMRWARAGAQGHQQLTPPPLARLAATYQRTADALAGPSPRESLLEHLRGRFCTPVLDYYSSGMLPVRASALRSTSKMTAVDHPNSRKPFIAVIGPSRSQRFTGTMSP